MDSGRKDTSLKQTHELASQWYSVLFERPLIQSTFLFKEHKITSKK